MGQVQGWRCWKLALVVSASLVVVSGCATAPEDQAMIESVVTALPQEVEGCTFVGNVDNDYISYTVQAGRAYRCPAGKGPLRPEQGAAVTAVTAAGAEPPAELSE